MKPNRRDGVSGGSTQRQNIKLTGETLHGPAEEAPSGREAYKGGTRKRGTDAKVTHPDRGSPQGGVISPLLSNIYLHVSISVLGERLGEDGTTTSFMNDVGCIGW